MERDSLNVPTTGSARAPVPRDDEEALTNLVLKSTGQVVVVMGPRHSGKTQFMLEQVLPRLKCSVPVLFFDCAARITDEALDAVGRPGTVVVLDSFDRFLRLPQAVREPGLGALSAEKRHATVVLVADKHCLPDLFELRSLVPDILEHLFELTELRLTTELPHYCPAPGVAPLEWKSSLIEALEDELARSTESTVTSPLVAIIDEGVRAGAYDQKRGLVGLLESHLELTLSRLSKEPGFDESAVEVARATLKEIAAGGQRGAPSLVGLAERQDVPAENPVLCFRWLVGNSGLLKESPGEGLVFQPAQLRIVLEKWLEEDRNACAKAERYLADGVEGRHKVGTLLPRERFKDIHAQRSLLRTTSEQASFLALCALRICPDDNPGPVNYWFRRIGDVDVQVGTLSEALVELSIGARRRAASMLAGFDDPRVHGHLCRAALEDAAAEVRDQAVGSLSVFTNEGPIRAVLTRTASEGSGETRIRAVQALHIFRDEECARFLEEIVSSSGEVGVRQAAIDSLAGMQIEAAVSALVRTALHDPDQKDRDRAGAVLAHLGSENLIEFGLNATLQDWVGWRPAADARWWRKIGQWPGAIVILVLGMFIHGLPLLVVRKWLAGAAFLAVEIAWFIPGERFLGEWYVLGWLLNWWASIAVAAWLTRQKQAPSGSFYHVFSEALLANTMLTSGLLLHGLGHWITGRKRRAWQSVGIEALALLAILPTIALKNVFNLGIGRTGFDKFAEFLFYLYCVGGMALSWLWAVSSHIMDERWGRRGPWLSEPHSRVLRALLKAPESAVVLRHNLGTDTAKSGNARMLLGRFGQAVPGTALLSVLKQDAREGKRSPPEIQHCLSRHKDAKGYENVVMEAGELFDRLPLGQRNQVVDLLVSYPTETSIRCLYERRSALRPWNRIRLWLAMVVRPFRGWHWMVRLATLAGALLAVLLIVDGIRTSINPGWPQIKELRRLSKTDYPDKSLDIARVADFLAQDYPVSSVPELVAVFGEVKKEYAPHLASSLGLVATFGAAEELPALEANARTRKIAAEALVEAALDTKKEQPVRDAALQALQEAAERGGSIEVVAGLKTVFDKAEPFGTRSAAKEQLLHTQLIQGRVAKMLAAVAKQSTDVQGSSEQSKAAKDAIADRADALAVLLRNSANFDVEKSALDALEASGRDAAVNAIKTFIQFGGVLAPPQQPDDSATMDPQAVRAAGDLARIQWATRAMAVDSLRAIQTPAAQDAFNDLKQMTGLPPEIAQKLGVPPGHAEAKAREAQARRLQENGKLDEALNIARQAVGADKNFPDARGTLGSILYQKGKLEESLSEFRVATTLAPKYTWAYYMQAVILKDEKKYNEAENASSKAIQSDPHYPYSYAILRRIYLDQNLDSKAITELLRFQRRYPDVAEIYAQLGWVYHERIARSDPSAYELAYEAYQKSLHLLGPRDKEQTLNLELDLLECSLTTGRYQEVTQRVPKLLERVGQDPDERMALKVLLLAAQALQHDDGGALKTLVELENIYNREFKPLNARHNWVYDGTQVYLENRVPRSAESAAVLALVRALNNISTARMGNGSPPVIRQELFDNVRKALQPVKNGMQSETVPLG